MQITRENVQTFKIGSEVEFNYGAMFGSEKGEIIGWETTKWGTHLIAQTEEGKIKQIHNFTDMRSKVGAYLI